MLYCAKAVLHWSKRAWKMGNRYADWFRQAEADLRHARNSVEDGDFEWSCFAAQQAAEKAPKACLPEAGHGCLGTYVDAADR